MEPQTVRVSADSPDEDDVVSERAAVVRRLRNEDSAHARARMRVPATVIQASGLTRALGYHAGPLTTFA